jgi:alkylresorcinol/alkylpyrone synthase
MFLTAIGTATPEHRYTQAQCWDALVASRQFAALDRGARVTLQRVLLGRSGISARHLALDPLSDAFDTDPDTLHRRFALNAPLLASRAATRALARAGRAAAAIDVVLVSTCTGYLCPGLSSYVAEQLGLRPDVLALDLVGQGCVAALPNLRAAEALLASGRCETALSICVEVCSAAFYLDEDPGVLISACLFGDGAGAAVLERRRPASGRSAEWMSAASTLEPSERDTLRFEQRGGMLRNILSPRVPALAAEHAERVLDAVLKHAERNRSDIAAWIWHAGGRTVLESLQQRLGLSARDVAHSAAVLNDYGNLSSPFVHFVLERAFREAPSGWWWLSSFGAGFSCHGALLRVSDADE